MAISELDEDEINKKGRRLCGEPTKYVLKCYSKDEDSTFKEFISGIMNISDDQCSICQKKRHVHELKYYHGIGHIKITEPKSM